MTKKKPINKKFVDEIKYLPTRLRKDSWHYDPDTDSEYPEDLDFNHD